MSERQGDEPLPAYEDTESSDPIPTPPTPVAEGTVGSSRENEHKTPRTKVEEVAAEHNRPSHMYKLGPKPPCSSITH